MTEIQAEYRVTPSEHRIDTMDKLNAIDEKLCKLRALLTMTFGNNADAFNALSDLHRDNYLWACSTLVDECKAAVDSLSPTEVQATSDQ